MYTSSNPCFSSGLALSSSVFIVIKKKISKNNKREKKETMMRFLSELKGYYSSNSPCLSPLRRRSGLVPLWVRSIETDACDSRYSCF